MKTKVLKNDLDRAYDQFCRILGKIQSAVSHVEVCQPTGDDLIAMRESAAANPVADGRLVLRETTWVKHGSGASDISRWLTGTLLMWSTRGEPPGLIDLAGCGLDGWPQCEWVLVALHLALQSFPLAAGKLVLDVTLSRVFVVTRWFGDLRVQTLVLDMRGRDHHFRATNHFRAHLYETRELELRGNSQLVDSQLVDVGVNSTIQTLVLRLTETPDQTARWPANLCSLTDLRWISATWPHEGEGGEEEEAEEEEEEKEEEEQEKGVDLGEVRVPLAVEFIEIGPGVRDWKFVPTGVGMHGGRVTATWLPYRHNRGGILALLDPCLSQKGVVARAKDLTEVRIVSSQRPGGQWEDCDVPGRADVQQHSSVITRRYNMLGGVKLSKGTTAALEAAAEHMRRFAPSTHGVDNHARVTICGPSSVQTWGSPHLELVEAILLDRLPKTLVQLVLVLASGFACSFPRTLYNWAVAPIAVPSKRRGSRSVGKGGKRQKNSHS
jgi:hypothetical protein